MNAPQLHVFFDGDDYVVAANLDDAKALMAEADHDYAGDELRQLPDGKLIKFHDEDGAGHNEQSCAELATGHGRGHLGSVNW